MATPGGFEDDSEFVNIWTGKEKSGSLEDDKTPKDYYKQWIGLSSAPLSIPPITGAETLRSIYPNHTLVLTNDYGMSILGFPGAQITPLEKTPLITNLFFMPLARSAGIPGLLLDNVEFGAFNIVWKHYEYIVYTVTYPTGYGSTSQYFILHKGPEEASRLFLLAAGTWADALHDEIWVFNQGFWRKDHGLWSEIQKADWKDVILKEEFKKALQKDVYGFFASEAIYKDLAIPWKRGLIMYGPPGNGKTISLKTIMKTCGDKGFAPLYVKSFQSWKGEEGAMADVFDKARQLAPCVVILEDLDSLINDRNRSFFLNQLDGLEGNDGLLIIGTTNHFERLDPGLSTRPSRFDRKYKFDDPDQEERKLYAQYWQKKLASNKEIEFTDNLVDDVAKTTDRFSFAYLKEAFVSSLVTFASIEGEKPKFESILKGQIETLRKQLDKSLSRLTVSPSRQDAIYDPRGPQRQLSSPSSAADRDIRIILDKLSDSAPPSRVYRGSNGSPLDTLRKDIRPLLDALSESLASLDLPTHRIYDTALPTPHEPQADDGTGRNYRELLDRIASQNDRIDAMLAESRFYSSPAPSRSRQNNWAATANVASAFAGSSISPAVPQLPQFRMSGTGPQFGSDLA